VGLGLGLCQPSSSCRSLYAGPAVSTVLAWDVALLSIMSIIRGPIFISAVNLPDAISHRLGAVSFACAVLFCGRSRHLIGLQARRLTCIHAKTAPLSAIVVSSSTSRTWRVISFGAARLQIRFRQNFRNFRQNCRLYISHFRVYM